MPGPVIIHKPELANRDYCPAVRIVVKVQYLIAGIQYQARNAQSVFFDRRAISLQIGPNLGFICVFDPDSA